VLFFINKDVSNHRIFIFLIQYLQNEHYKDKLDSENSLYKNFVKKHLILSSVNLVAI
jgi:hypothetical protein